MPARCSLGHENPDGSAFCDECGEPLASTQPTVAATQQAVRTVPSASVPKTGNQICPACGATNPAGEAFCSNCGVSLQGAPVPASIPMAPAPPATPPSPATPSLPAPIGSAVSTAAALQARLIVEADNQEFDISSKDNITIGREDIVSNIYPDVDLTPHGGEEGGVSRLHARIFVQNNQYMLEDENSTNFTFLNRQRLAAKTATPLNDNDEVRLGRIILRFKTP